MVWETQKIFEDDNILVNPTAVRVPVIYGHSEAINIETKTKITAAEATKPIGPRNIAKRMATIKLLVGSLCFDINYLQVFFN
jgi:aspartate-semialdehyde dehydrogenase